MSIPSKVIVGNEDNDSQGEGGDEGQANDPIIETEALPYPESGVVPQGNRYEDEPYGSKLVAAAKALVLEK